MFFRLSFFLLTFLSLSSFVTAKVWVVDKNPMHHADFTEVSTAVQSNNVISGDTIYILPTNSFEPMYENVSITKKLCLIGTGFFLAENLNMQANTYSAFVYVALLTGSSGSELIGIDLFATIHTSNITISRCKVRHMEINDVNDIIITQSFFYNSRLLVNGTCLNIQVSNCIFDAPGPTNGTLGLVGNSSSVLAVINNVFVGNYANLRAYSSLIVNNYLSQFVDGFYNAVQYNMFSCPPYSGLDSTNQFNIPFDHVFIGGISPDGKYKLKSGSPAIGAGMNGEDIGAYGGSMPYVLSGMPPIPAIYYLQAPLTGSTNTGLPVTIKAKSHN